MAIGKKRLAERLSQAITGALPTAADSAGTGLLIQEDETCSKALAKFAYQADGPTERITPPWQLLPLLP